MAPPLAMHLTFNHVNFRFPWSASFACLENRWGAIKWRGVGGGVGVVVDGGSGLISGLVTGRTEKRLIAGWIDPRRVEAGGARGTRGCSDMRRFIIGGVDTGATDARREATWLSGDTGVGCRDMRRSFEEGGNRVVVDPDGVKLPIPSLRRGGNESGGVATRD
jgi:hypothetical protein